MSRKFVKPSTTRGKNSRITTFRLPYVLEDALKARANELRMPWQTLLKDLLSEALGLKVDPVAEVTMVSSENLHEALKSLGKR